MQQVREKAEYWLAMNVAGYTEQQVDYLATLLKDQDRDTRHACAEAVAAQALVGDNAIDVDVTYSACMNVKAV